MIDDPIVEETRAARAEIVNECGEDIHTFFEYIRERERKNPQGVVTLTPNAPDAATRNSASR